jgi:hypothetical protein
MRNVPGGRTFCGMRASSRALAVDLGLGLIGVVLTAIAAWSVNVISTGLAGPA